MCSPLRGSSWEVVKPQRVTSEGPTSAGTASSKACATDGNMWAGIAEVSMAADWACDRWGVSPTTLAL